MLTTGGVADVAGRARRKVQDHEAEEDRARSRTVVEAFLAAARGGDFAALLALLDPEVVVRADARGGPHRCERAGTRG